MAKWGKWVAVVGGVIAVVGQWAPQYYVPVIGGVVAVIGGLMSE